MSWWDIVLRIACATLIGTIIGVEREYKNRPAGMRTHVLVCLGACLIAVLECCLRAENMGEIYDGVSYTMGRMSAQVISGIGFLGAGTIFTAQKKISGLTTAASLWNAACLGLASGMGYYWIALFGCAVVMAVLLMLQRIVHVNAIKRVEIKFVHRNETMAFINEYFGQSGILTIDLDFHAETKEGQNLYTNIYTLKLPSSLSYTDVVNRLVEHVNVQSVRTTNS